MAKYRIKGKGNFFYPQKRTMFIWFDIESIKFTALTEVKAWLDTYGEEPKVKIYPYP